MARVYFNAALINDLRNRVIAHNKAVGESGRVTKLEELKQLYKGAYRKARGPNPGARAMAKVDEFLDGLAKAGGQFEEHEHRRDEKGRFADKPDAPEPPKAPKPPKPMTVAQHRKRQDADPEYRAMTTAVIPSQQYELRGILLRDLGSVVGGAAITAAMLRNKPTSWTNRAMRGALGGIGGAAIRVPTRLAAGLGIKAVNATARGFGRQRPLLDPEKGNRAASFAGEYGRKAGRKIADVIASAGGVVGRATMDVMTNHNPRTMKEKVWNRVNQAGTFAALSVPPTMLVQNSMHGWPWDPQLIGRGLDMESYREIRKMDGVRAAIMEKLSGMSVEDALQKASPRMWSKAGQVALPGAAAALGAAAGGGIGYAAQRFGEKRKGNPYRDEEGKFTSKDRAVATIGGAVLGGALAGAAAAYGMRRGNVRAFAQRIANAKAGRAIALEEINNAPAGRMRTFSPPLTGGVTEKLGRTAQLLRNKDKRISEILNEKLGAKERIAAIEQYGKSSPFHFIDKLQDDLTQRLSDMMTLLPNVRLVRPKGGAGTAQTVGELIEAAGKEAAAAGQRGAAATQGAGRGRAKGELFRLLQTADDATFDRMIAGLTDDQKAPLRQVFKMRQDIPDQVRSQLAGHGASITAKRAEVATLAEASRKADEAAKAAQLVRSAARSDAPNLKEIEDAAEAAQEALKAAAKAEKEAQDALKRLIDNPVGVKNPITGEDVKPLTATEVDARKNVLEASLRAKAERQFEREVAQARKVEAGEHLTWANRVLAAQHFLGLRAGYTPKATRAAASQLAAAGKLVDKNTRALAIAENSLTAAMKARGEQKKGTALWDAANDKVTELRTARDGVQAQLRAAELRMNLAASKLEEAEAAALAAQGKPGLARRILANGVMRQLGRDVSRLRGGVQKPVDDFIASPTGEQLNAFAKSVKEAAQGAGETAWNTLMEAFNQSFKTVGPDSQKRWSMSRILSSGFGRTSIVASVGAGAFEAGQWGYQKLFGVKPGEKAVDWPLAAEGSGRAFEVHHEVEPLTGAGYTIISVADPAKKGERVVLWGERAKGEKREDGQIFMGARMSAVKQRIQEEKQKAQQQAQGGGGGDLKDANGMPGQDRDAVNGAINKLRNGGKLKALDATDGTEGAFSFRSPDDVEGDEADKTFRKWMEGNGNMTQADGLKGRAFFNALSEGLFSKQGQVLKPAHAYRLLTGYMPNGEQTNSGKRIAPKITDFGQGGDAVDGASALISAAQGMFNGGALHDWQKMQLHRAVNLIASVKGFSAETRKGLHEKIRGGGSASGAGQGASQGAGQGGSPKRDVNPDDVVWASAMGDAPPGWGSADFENAVDNIARSMANGDQAILRSRPDVLKEGLRQVALMAWKADQDLTEPEAVQVAAHAIRATRRQHGVKSVESWLSSDVGPDLDAFLAGLNTALDAAAQKRKKEAFETVIDDLEELVKFAVRPWDESKHRRDGEGEFAHKDGREGRETEQGRAAAAPRAPRAPRSAKPPAERPLSEPVRLSTEVGSGVASMAAWNIAEKFLPPGARMAGKAGAFAAKMGVSGVAGMGGGAAGGAAGEAYYRARGKKSPGAYEGPNYSGAGEIVADLAGNTAGWMGGAKAGALAGTAIAPGAGTAVGAFVGGVAGGIAGSELGRRAYRYLSAYGTKGSGLLERYLGGDKSMKKRAPEARLTPHARMQINDWFAGYGPLAKRVARHFEVAGR